MQSHKVRYVYSQDHRPVPSYRIYQLDPAHHIKGPPAQIECTSDDQAIEVANAYPNGPIEIWQAARLVKRLYPEGTSS